MKNILTTIALALIVCTLSASAQETNTPPVNPGGPGHGFHILPPRASEKLNLTADQQKQVAALEVEVKAKLEKILTPEQLQELKQMRPPQHPGGRNGGGNNGGGPGNGPGGPPPEDQ